MTLECDPSAISYFSSIAMADDQISTSRNRTEFYYHSNCSAKGQVNALKASYIQFYNSFP